MCFLKSFTKKREAKLRDKRIRTIECSITELELFLPYVKGISYGDNDPELLEYLKEIEDYKLELKQLKKLL